MKVQHLPALIVALTAAVIAMAAPANAQTNVLIMNEERIIAESQVGQHISTRMQAIRAEMDGDRTEKPTGRCPRSPPHDDAAGRPSR